MSVSFGFFPYEAMHYKAAQAYLDRKAQKGWMLKHIYLGAIARFEEAEKPRHFVDLDLTRSDFDGTDEAYLQLCEDAGWEAVQEVRGMLIFRALPGRGPAPIQSDSEMEWDRFWKKYARKNLITSALVTLAAMGLLALVLRLPSSGAGRSLAVGVASNSFLFYLLAFGLALLSLLLSLVGVPLYLFRCRRSSQVEAPNRVWAWLQDTPFRLYIPLYLLAACIAMAELFGLGKTVDLSWSPMYEGNTATVEACREYPVLLADDLGLIVPGTSQYNTRYLDGHRGLLADYLSYSELLDHADEEGAFYVLTTERYDCAGTALARWVLDIRREETRNGTFLWGELDWEPADLPGFEESYTCRGNSYLLLRRGKVVTLVGCTGVNLTAPENFRIVCERLELE